MTYIETECQMSEIAFLASYESCLKKHTSDILGGEKRNSSQHVLFFHQETTTKQRSVRQGNSVLRPDPTAR